MRNLSISLHNSVFSPLFGHKDVEADLRSVLLYPSTSEGQVEEGVMVLKTETDGDSLSVVTDISEICRTDKKKCLLKELQH